MKDEILIVYIKETDGEPEIAKVEAKEVREFVKDMKESEYALIGGEILKDFDGIEIGFDLVKHTKAMLRLKQESK